MDPPQAMSVGRVDRVFEDFQITNVCPITFLIRRSGRDRQNAVLSSLSRIRF